ncbi:MAG: DUF3568 family protein [Pseudomonadota bacterium]
MKKRLALLVYLGFFALMTSCVPLLVAGGAGLGAGGAIWYKGNLETTLQATIIETRSATLKTLKDFNLPVVSEKNDNLVVIIDSEISDGTKIWIKLNSLNLSTTEVNIRVGILGDEARSNRILEGIKGNLKLIGS